MVPLLMLMVTPDDGTVPTRLKTLVNQIAWFELMQVEKNLPGFEAVVVQPLLLQLEDELVDTTLTVAVPESLSVSVTPFTTAVAVTTAVFFTDVLHTIFGGGVLPQLLIGWELWQLGTVTPPKLQSLPPNAFGEITTV